MSKAKSCPASSHDHIQTIQRLTGGVILVAPHKKPSVAQLSLYTPGASPAYFVNCPFPSTILQQPKRDKKFAIKPGFRRDITLDFEKKLNGVKDPSGTDAEKKELIAALKKLPCVAWAGKTPHGVHCGVYFSDWTETRNSGRILDWITDELAAIGYSGPMQLDWSPSPSLRVISSVPRSWLIISILQCQPLSPKRMVWCCAIRVS